MPKQRHRPFGMQPSVEVAKRFGIEYRMLVWYHEQGVCPAIQEGPRKSLWYGPYEIARIACFVALRRRIKSYSKVRDALLILDEHGLLVRAEDVRGAEEEAGDAEGDGIPPGFGYANVFAYRLTR